MIIQKKHRADIARLLVVIMASYLVVLSPFIHIKGNEFSMLSSISDPILLIAVSPIVLWALIGGVTGFWKKEVGGLIMILSGLLGLTLGLFVGNCILLIGMSCLAFSGFSSFCCKLLQSLVRNDTDRRK
jgi:hypothetical protein